MIADGGIKSGDAVRALGLMSGTSLDGVDAAVLETDGERIFSFGPSRTFDYSTDDKSLIREAFGWDRDNGAADLIDQRHIEAVQTLGERVDLIGYHGQTVAHDPENGRTRQLGDGAALARAIGAPVVWDFRSDDMAAGGEGAPLAPFFHWAAARWMGADEPVAFVNLGGVGNVTWVDPTADTPEAEGALMAFDTGPANALLDDLMLARTGTPMDRDGAAAAKGKVPDGLIAELAPTGFTARRPPKSLDRDYFHDILPKLDGLSTEDAAATLTALTVGCLAASRAHVPNTPARWLVCGGGRHNRTMMRMLGEKISGTVEPVEAAGLDGDMIEAQAFAFLAVRRARGLPTSAPGTTGCRAPVSGGRVSLP